MKTNSPPKQALIDEATAYYLSYFTGTFDQQKEQLKTIQGEIKSVAASVDTTSRGNDPHFLVKMESTFERISNLQKKIQAASLTVPKPLKMTLKSVDTDEYMKAKYYFNKPADVKMRTRCNAIHVGVQTFTLILRDSRGNIRTTLKVICYWHKVI